MIQILNLEKVYGTGVKALSDIHMEIQQGEFVVFLGPSGAGKSSLLCCINGLVTPTHGSVIVDNIQLGKNRKDLKKVRSLVG
ncbi:ATP-binding cassette domain-containing protein [Effusibacillus dendaii]|uniref:ABC transporter domain-containing protein n=1 Tax=Effusibacillus dendaii TaxID=2743772 RepID=A0A7I8D5Z6_9BACL|nr:ATP-binding cassette domain-containing protein [Effusibacillus dendaii]BCJ85554.1 hypothetical protein skT53_05390 [Effusibacillus dendaii]